MENVASLKASWHARCTDIRELEQIPWIVCPFPLPGISRTVGLPMDVDRISIFVGLNGFGFRRDIGTCSGLQDYGIVEDFEHCTILFSSSLYPSTKTSDGIARGLRRDFGLVGFGCRRRRQENWACLRVWGASCDLLCVVARDWCVPVPVCRCASVLSRLREDCNPGAILDNGAILAR